LYDEKMQQAYTAFSAGGKYVFYVAVLFFVFSNVCICDVKEGDVDAA